MSGDDGFDLVLSLDGRSSDFVLGVEMGRLWEQLKDSEPFEQTVHAENLEIVMRMREQCERDFVVEDADASDEWVHLIIGVWA